MPEKESSLEHPSSEGESLPQTEPHGPEESEQERQKRTEEKVEGDEQRLSPEEEEIIKAILGRNRLTPHSPFLDLPDSPIGEERKKYLQILAKRFFRETKGILGDQYSLPQNFMTGIKAHENMILDAIPRNSEEEKRLQQQRYAILLKILGGIYGTPDGGLVRFGLEASTRNRKLAPHFGTLNYILGRTLGYGPLSRPITGTTYNLFSKALKESGLDIREEEGLIIGEEELARLRSQGIYLEATTSDIQEEMRAIFRHGLREGIKFQQEYGEKIRGEIEGLKLTRQNLEERKKELERLENEWESEKSRLSNKYGVDIKHPLDITRVINSENEKRERVEKRARELESDLREAIAQKRSLLRRLWDFITGRHRRELTRIKESLEKAHSQAQTIEKNIGELQQIDKKYTPLKSWKTKEDIEIAIKQTDENLHYWERLLAQINESLENLSKLET